MIGETEIQRWDKIGIRPNICLMVETQLDAALIIPTLLFQVKHTA